jgi:hypothetical protein
MNSIGLTKSRSFSRDVLSSRLLQHQKGGGGGMPQHHQQQQHLLHIHQPSTTMNGGGGGGRRDDSGNTSWNMVSGNHRLGGGIGASVSDKNKLPEPIKQQRNWLGVPVHSKNTVDKTPTKGMPTISKAKTTTKDTTSTTTRPQTPNHKMSAGRDFTDRLLLRTNSPGEKKHGRRSFDSYYDRSNQATTDKSTNNNVPLHQLNDRIARIEQTLFEAEKHHLQQQQNDDTQDDALYGRSRLSRSRSRSADRSNGGRKLRTCRSKSQERQQQHQQRSDDDYNETSEDERGGLRRFLNPNAPYHHPKYRSTVQPYRRAPSNNNNIGGDHSLPTLFAHTKRLVEEEAASWPGSKSDSDDINLLNASTSSSNEMILNGLPHQPRTSAVRRSLATSDSVILRDRKESRHQSQQHQQQTIGTDDGQGQFPILVAATPMPIPVRASLGCTSIGQSQMTGVKVVSSAPSGHVESPPQASTPKTSNVLQNLANETQQQQQRMLDPVEKFRHPFKEADKDEYPIGDGTSYEYYHHHSLGDIDNILSDLSASTSGVIVHQSQSARGLTDGLTRECYCHPGVTNNNHMMTETFSSPTSAFATPAMACLMFPSVVKSTCNIHSTNHQSTVETMMSNGGTTTDAPTGPVPSEVLAGRIAAVGTPNLLDSDDENSVIEKEEPLDLIDSIPPQQSSHKTIQSYNVSNSSSGGSREMPSPQHPKTRQLHRDSPMASSLLDRSDDRYWMYKDNNDTFDQAARKRLQSTSPILDTDEPGIKRNITVKNNKTPEFESGQHTIGSTHDDEDEEEKSKKNSSLKSRSTALKSRRITDEAHGPEGMSGSRMSSREITTTGRSIFVSNTSSPKPPTQVVKQHPSPTLNNNKKNNCIIATRSKSTLSRSRSRSPTPDQVIEEAANKLKAIQENRCRQSQQQQDTVKSQSQSHQQESFPHCATPYVDDVHPLVVNKNERLPIDAKGGNNLVPLQEIMTSRPTQQQQQREQQQPSRLPTTPKPLYFQTTDLVHQRRHRVMDDALMDIRHLNNSKPISIGKIQHYKLSPYHPKGQQHTTINKTTSNGSKQGSNNNHHQWGWFGRKKSVEGDPIIDSKTGVTVDVVGSSVESGITSDGGASDVGMTLIFGGRNQTNRRNEEVIMTRQPNHEHKKEDYQAARNNDDHIQGVVANMSMGTRDSTTTTSTNTGSSVTANHLKHAITFDDIIQDLQRFESQLPNAEFAVVEMGEDADTVPAQSFLMNKGAVEHGLMMNGGGGGNDENEMGAANNWPFGLPPILERDVELYGEALTGGGASSRQQPSKALDDSAIDKLEPSVSFISKINNLKQIQESLREERTNIRRSVMRKQ